MANLAEAERQVKEVQDDNAKPKAQQDRDAKERQAAAQRALREAAYAEAAEKSLAAIRAIREEGANEASVLEMVVLLGALGGSLHLVGSLVKYVGNRQLKRSWLLYYFYTPVAGAALAPIVYTRCSSFLILTCHQGESGSCVDQSSSRQRDCPILPR